MNRQAELVEKVETLQNMLVSYATGGGADEEEYRALRGELMAEPSIKHLLPRFLRTCHSLSQFWGFIKQKFATYQERRVFIWEAFSPAIRRLEGADSSPVDEPVSEVLKRFDSETIHQVWQRALERREEDPEGAITSARTLLESVCKHILDETEATYSANADLPTLYKLTAKQLNLAPSEHTEQIFRQILGGCQTVVEALGAMRNKLSDAHGKGKKPVRPAARHAELAVNLAGAMATFLVRTWEFHEENAA
jgi:hypothetical protein